MPMCFDAECNHHNFRETCRFFRFPTSRKELKKWGLVIARRIDTRPTDSSRLCSCHFVNGEKINGPTLFKSNATKLFSRLYPADPPTRKRKAVRTVKEELHKTRDMGPEPALVKAAKATPVFSAVAADAMITHLEKELESMTIEFKYHKERLTLHMVDDKTELIRTMTGLPNAQVLRSLHKFCISKEVNFYLEWAPRQIRTEEQLLMTLMKLRLDYPLLDLAQRFGTSQATVSNIFHTWLHLLHTYLFLTLKIPSRRKNQTSLPNSFISHASSTRIILDCTEVEIDVPARMDQNNVTYSHYKSRNTFKGLVGVAPNGSVTFLSDLYPGSLSDKAIVKDSNVLSHMEPGDMVMADKGFLLHDIMPAGVGLNIPPFLSGPQFSESEVLATRNIARARIHVERAINRIKNFRILGYIPASLRNVATIIFQTCGALTNLQQPLIREVYKD